MAQASETTLTRTSRRKTADFFISYTWSDLATAKILRDWLETVGHTTHMQERDFTTGGHIPTMIEAGLKAKRLLAVMSDAYLKSGYCKAELGAAFHRDPTNSQLRMVIVRISACEVPELLAPISRIELVGKSGEATKTAFLECIRKLKPAKRAASKSASPKSIAAVPPPQEANHGPKASVYGDGVAFIGDNNKIYMPGEPRKRGRAKPPADVVTEDQALKLKALINEIMDLDAVSYGKGLSVAQLRQKWWGALEKVVPKTTYTNYSQSKFQKAMKWLREQRGRLLNEVGEGQPGLSREAHIRTIHTLLTTAGIKDAQRKKLYYVELSERLGIFPPFSSSTNLSDDNLPRVVRAMRYDFKKL